MRTRALSFLLAVIALCGTVASYAIDRDEYVSKVMGVLRAHVSLLEELAVTDRFKYSDNLVRHAAAIQRTFGLLGPMEWHAAESAKLRSQREGSGINLDEDHFDELARASRRSIRELVRAAHDSMEEYDREGILTAIADMKQSCNDCHRLLPTSVAPDLWEPLERN